MKHIIDEADHKFNYTGVDISKQLIETARENHPECEFFIGSPYVFDPKNNTFDRVVSLGTTVHDVNFYKTLERCYDLCSGKLFFDMRLTFELPTLADVSYGFTKDDSGAPYPYVVANYFEF